MQVEHRDLGPGLAVTIHAHDVALQDGGSCAAVTIASSGLAALGQRELSLTLLRTGPVGEGVPPGILEYLRWVKGMAAKGQLVAAGDVSGFRAPGPLAFGDFVGLAFCEASTIPGVAVPEGALAGILLRDGELAMAAQCSVRRVLHGLGKLTRHYPNPYWSNPLRQSIYAVPDVERSLLAKMPRAVVREASATLEGDAMELVLPTAFARSLAERLAAQQPATVLPGSYGDSSAALVWSPGQTEPEGIVAPGRDGSRIAATFVALVPHVDTPDDIRFMEDGYAALLSGASLRRLVSALAQVTPFELRAGSDARSLLIRQMAP